MPYEKNILELALEGRTREILLALQIIPDSTEDEMLKDGEEDTYKEYMRVKAELKEVIDPSKRTNLLKEAKMWFDMLCTAHRTRMIGHNIAKDTKNDNEKSNKLPPFRLIYTDSNGNIAVEKTREELEAEMKQKMLEDEIQYKALSERAAQGNNENSSTAKS